MTLLTFNSTLNVTLEMFPEANGTDNNTGVRVFFTSLGAAGKLARR